MVVVRRGTVLPDVARAASSSCRARAPGNVWITGAFAATVPLVRVAVYYAAPAWYPRTGYTFETVGDAIAIGCLLAGFRSQLWNLPRYRALLESAWFWVVPAVVLAISGAERPRLQALFGITLMDVGAAVCIDWAIRNANSVVGRVLNWAPLALVGQMSYSLYLWQQPFLDRSSTAWWTRFPLNIALAATAASASYYLVERPSLNARKRIEAWWRRGRTPAQRNAALDAFAAEPCSVVSEGAATAAGATRRNRPTAHPRRGLLLTRAFARFQK